MACFGLQALQHRGQESAGIAVGVLAAAYIAVCAVAAAGGTTLRGTQVLGVDVGGLTAQQVRDKWQREGDAACRKETMAGYLAMADRLGLHLGSVTVPMAGRLRLLRAMPSLQSMTFVCLCFEGSSVLSLLVENGAYRYSSRSRVFSEPGTLDFGTEMTRSVSGTMQFHTTGRPASPLTDVFYAGCPDDDFEVCLAGIRELGLRVSRLPECPAFRALPNGERLSDWLGCAEALIR